MGLWGMNVEAIGEILSVIDSLPVPATVLVPRENKSGSVVDFDISHANDRMRELLANASKMSNVLDDEKLSALIRNLVAARDSAQVVMSRLRIQGDQAESELEYQLDSRWHGSNVIAIASSVRTTVPTAQSVAYSAEIIVKAMPEMPVAYGVLVDGQ